MEPSQMKQAWAKRGFTYTLWTDPPGQVWQDFVHEVDELVTLVGVRLSKGGRPGDDITTR